MERKRRKTRHAGRRDSSRVKGDSGGRERGEGGGEYWEFWGRDRSWGERRERERM